MKKSLYNLLSMIPIYGTFLKFSSKGEMRLCSPLYQDFLDEGINPNDIFLLLEKKYPGEVVTRDPGIFEQRVIRKRFSVIDIILVKL